MRLKTWDNDLKKKKTQINHVYYTEMCFITMYYLLITYQGLAQYNIINNTSQLNKIDRQTNKRFL